MAISCSIWDPSSPSRDEPCPLQWSLNHWTSREFSQVNFNFYSLISNLKVAFEIKDNRFNLNMHLATNKNNTIFFIFLVVLIKYTYFENKQKNNFTFVSGRKSISYSLIKQLFRSLFTGEQNEKSRL